MKTSLFLAAALLVSTSALANEPMKATPTATPHNSSMLDRPAADAVPTVNNTMSTSSRDSVRAAQSALNAKTDHMLTVDGRLGTATRQAIRDFQRQNGLTVNGQLDTATINSLGISSEFERAPASTTDNF